MALPYQISSNAQLCKPILRFDAGNTYYSFHLENQSNDIDIVVRSPGGTSVDATWTEIENINIENAVGQNAALDVVTDGTDYYAIVYVNSTNSSTNTVYIYKFTVSTETLSSVSSQSLAYNVNQQNWVYDSRILIAAAYRSDATIIIAYPYQWYDKGKYYNNLRAIEYDISTGWSSEITTGPAGAQNINDDNRIISACAGSSDRLHLFYIGYNSGLTNPYQVEHVAITSSNTFTTPNVVDANGSTGYGSDLGGAHGYNDSGTIYMPWYSISSTTEEQHVSVFTSADSPSHTTSEVKTNSSLYFTGTIDVVKATNVWTIWREAQGTNYQTYASEYDTSWQTPDLWQDDIGNAYYANGGGAAVNGSKVAWLQWDSSSGVYVDEESLSTATTYTKSASLTSYLEKQANLKQSALAAYLQSTEQKQASVDAYLSALIEKTLDLTAYLEAQGVMKTSDLSAYLQATDQIKTSDLSAYLRAAVTRATDLSAYLQKTGVLTADITAYLKKAEALTTALDAYLVLGEATTYTKTAQIDALLRKLVAVTASVSAYLERQAIAATAQIAAYLQAPESVSTDLSAYLQKAEIKTADLTAYLSALEAKNANLAAYLARLNITNTADLTAYLQKQQALTASATAYLKKSETATASLDAYLVAVGAQVKTVDLTAYLLAQGLLRTASLDAMLQATESKTSSLTAYLVAVQSKQVALDALMQKAETKTVSVEALLQAGVVKQTDLSAYLVNLQVKQAVLDSLLQKTEAKTANADALIQATEQKQSGLDALLQKVAQTVTATLDAVIVSIRYLTAGLDALLQKAGLSLSAALDAYLQWPGGPACMPYEVLSMACHWNRDTEAEWSCETEAGLMTAGVETCY